MRFATYTPSTPIINYQLSITNCELSITNYEYNAINTFSNPLIFKSAADGSEKPAGAKPTGHGVAGLRARRHRYPDVLCG